MKMNKFYNQAISFLRKQLRCEQVKSWKSSFNPKPVGRLLWKQQKQGQAKKSKLLFKSNLFYGSWSSARIAIAQKICSTRFYYCSTPFEQ